MSFCEVIPRNFHNNFFNLKTKSYSRVKDYVVFETMIIADQPKKQVFKSDRILVYGEGEPKPIPMKIERHLIEAKSILEMLNIISDNEKKIAEIYFGRKDEDFLACDVCADILSQALKKRVLPMK